jgi:glycosyltransferase involved in cell wall biosynthesis
VKPKVSVIIPCYNYADYLKICLQSVLAQTFQDFEIIVVDDSSTDHTPEVVKDFSDPRLRYVRHEKNLGPAAAFNTGINLAQGKYITVIGADDVMMPDNIAVKVDILEHYPDIGLVHSNAELIDESGRILGKAHSRRCFDRVQKRSSFNDLLLNGNFIVASSVFVPKRCYEKVGLYDPDLTHSEDWDMWLRIAYHYDFAYLDSCLIQYRVHDNSLRHRNYISGDDWKAFDRILKRLFQQFPLASQGYCFKQVYWSTYFRMLNNKLGLLPLRSVLGLYLRGLRAFPQYLFTRKNVLFLMKCIIYGIFPQVAINWLRKVKRRKFPH